MIFEICRLNKILLAASITPLFLSKSHLKVIQTKENPFYSYDLKKHWTKADLKFLSVQQKLQVLTIAERFK